MGPNGSGKTTLMECALGLLQPIGITPDKELVFGERRLRAAQALEWATIPARIVKVDQGAGLSARDVPPR